MKLRTANSSRTNPLTANDVLLVTGGGKGIAAECAFTLAWETGCKLIIVGRSCEKSDPELKKNLARFRLHGIRFSYHAADVADREIVRAAVRDAEISLGVTTAVIHGAGINVPGLLETLNTSAFSEALKPKVKGLANVLDALDARALKWVVSFGSLIARSGMRGAGAYAVANEWLQIRMARFAAAHPHCRCLNIEWSLWSDTGIGVKLGSITSMVASGILPISPDRAIEALKGLLSDQTARGSIIVSSRFGTMSTMGMDQSIPPFHFLQHIRCHFPGIEIIAEVEITGKNEPYLKDHQWEGRPILPAVVGLEMMAQVAAAIGGAASCPIVFEDVCFDRAIETPLDEMTTLRIALAREDGRIEIAIRSSRTDFVVNHVTGFVRVKSKETGETPIIPASTGDPDVHTVDLNAPSELYNSLLFHGPFYHRVIGYSGLGARSCSARISRDEIEDARWICGDPAARDAVIHAIQACIPHLRLLPVSIEKIEIHAVSADEKRINANEVTEDENGFVYNLGVYSFAGILLETWTGLRLKQAGPLKPNTPWPLALLQNMLQRRVEAFFPSGAFNIELHRDRAAASTTHRFDGKPDSTDHRNLSRSYFSDCVINCDGSGRTAVDAERVSSREIATVDALLGEEGSRLVVQISAHIAESNDRAFTRVWSALECLTKLGVGPRPPLQLGEYDSDGWIHFCSGDLAIATFVADVREIGGEVCFTFAAERKPGEIVEVLQHVGFDDVNRVGTVNFSRYFDWQARSREAFLRKFAPSIHREIENGLVLATTEASCRYLAEVNPARELKIHLKLDSLRDQHFSISFEYLQEEHGRFTLVATGRQTVACLRRGSGPMSRVPVPDELRAALASFA